MKKLIQILIFICVVNFALGQTKPEGYLYRSDNYEKEGTSEFIYYCDADKFGYEFAYFVQKHPETSLINIPVEIIKQGSYFENSASTYRIDHKIHDEITCIHPDGRVQKFEKMPVVSFSDGFEEEGVIEYLGYEEGYTIYFTSKNPDYKINLISKPKSGNPVGHPYLYYMNSLQFPNDSNVYYTCRPASCEYIFGLEHPDGQLQYFTPCTWDVKAKKCISIK